MSFISEFKEFAVKGNVIDMAVGVVIGTAFGKIVASFVDDIIMPVMGKLVGGVDFSNLFINLGDGQFDSLGAAEAAGAPILKYGVFINTSIDFLIIAFAIFVAIKGINKLKRPAPEEEEAPATTPEDIQLLREIRDSLKRH